MTYVSNIEILGVKTYIFLIKVLKESGSGSDGSGGIIIIVVVSVQLICVIL